MKAKQLAKVLKKHPLLFGKEFTKDLLSDPGTLYSVKEGNISREATDHQTKNNSCDIKYSLISVSPKGDPLRMSLEGTVGEQLEELDKKGYVVVAIIEQNHRLSTFRTGDLLKDTVIEVVVEYLK